VIRRYASVLYILGILITGFGGPDAAAAALSWLNADGAHSAYDEAVLITVASGLLLSLSVRKGRREMRVRDSILLVALIWSLLPAFGALPLYLHIADLVVDRCLLRSRLGSDGHRRDGALGAR
jgi:trk system potassium uptake protein TrkH